MESSRLHPEERSAIADIVAIAVTIRLMFHVFMVLAFLIDQFVSIVR